MAIKVKPIDKITDKWVNRASAAGADYQAGVQNPRRDWADATSAAAPNYAAGVQAAIADGRFASGVTEAGTDKWKRKAADVGANRFPTGVTAARPDYANGVKPFLDVIANLELPVKRPKGDPANIQRVVVVATALRKQKLGK